MTEWRACVGYADYEISDDGQLRRRVAFRAFPAGMMKKPLPHPRGYICYGVGKARKELAHRLVALTFIGPPPSDRHEVAHNDGCRTNNRAANLRWALPAENQADRKLHGTYLHGDTATSNKITSADVAEIRRRYAQSGIRYRGGAVTMEDLATEFGVSQAQISRIVNGRQWHSTPTATS